jgi:energy-coupling factor transporter ATP-binding protein EcfA2
MTNKKINRSYPIQFASSGERQVIGLAAMLIQWERQAFKPIVLIDEPDIHLNPEYVTRLAEFMNGVFLKAKDFSCLVSTHSSDFIAANTENVYQITSDSKSIEKVDNLTSRVELLNSLGKRFDLAFLAPKIVYVEGVPNAKDHLEDFKVYQRLIDPLKNCVVFIPAGTDNKPGSGSKQGVVQTSDAFKTFISTITQQPSILNILALIDKDAEGILGQVGSNVLVTPYKTLENVFLFDIEAISKATSSEEKQFSVQDITNHLEAIEKDSSGKLAGIDGKVMTKKLYDRLATESSKVKNLTYKGFQFEVIKSVDLNRLPEEVSKFFNSIKGK